MADWRSQLALMKQSFEDGARQFPYFRAYMHEGTPSELYDADKDIRRMINEKRPGRIELQSRSFGFAKTDVHITFGLIDDTEANRSGCVLWQELATVAGACLPDHVAGLPREWPDFAQWFGDGKWLHLIFATAEKSRSGNLLQVEWFQCRGKCAFLIPNPFLASVAMIDQILEQSSLTPTDARNKFCYDEWQRGQTYMQIWLAVKKHPEWEQLGEEKAVRGPIQAWAKKMNLPVRKGEQGRKSAAKKR